MIRGEREDQPIVTQEEPEPVGVEKKICVKMSLVAMMEGKAIDTAGAMGGNPEWEPVLSQFKHVFVDDITAAPGTNLVQH